MLALLPPSSSVTRLICSAQPAMTARPTSVEPVKQILRTSGWSTKRWPTTLPLPGRICSTPSGSPASSAKLADAQCAERRHLSRFEHDGVAGGECGREAPAGDGHGEVPGHDDADDAQWLVEGDVEAAGHRDLLAALALGRPRVELQHVADVAGLPAGVGDHVAGVGHFEPGQLVEVGVHGGGEAPEQAGPVAGCHRPPGLEGGGGPADGSVGLLGAQPGDVGQDLAGGGIADVHPVIFADDGVVVGRGARKSTEECNGTVRDRARDLFAFAANRRPVQLGQGLRRPRREPGRSRVHRLAGPPPQLPGRGCTLEASLESTCTASVWASAPSATSWPAGSRGRTTSPSPSTTATSTSRECSARMEPASRRST